MLYVCLSVRLLKAEMYKFGNMIFIVHKGGGGIKASSCGPGWVQVTCRILMNR